MTKKLNVGFLGIEQLRTSVKILKAYYLGVSVLLLLLDTSYKTSHAGWRHQRVSAIFPPFNAVCNAKAANASRYLSYSNRGQWRLDLTGTLTGREDTSTLQEATGGISSTTQKNNTWALRETRSSKCTNWIGRVDGYWFDCYGRSGTSS